MKFSIQTAILAVIIGLIGVNILFFLRGLSLGSEISYYESEIAKIKDENVEYEQKIFKLESHVQTASLAAELEYGKYNDPIYVSLPKYARSR